MLTHDHPLTSSLRRRWATASLFAAVCLTAYGLLTVYAGLTRQAALADSFLSTLLFFAAAYVYWPIGGSLGIGQVTVLWALAIQGGQIAINFIVLQVSGLEKEAEFLLTLPFRLLFGLLGWTILVLGYKDLHREEEQQETEMPENAAETKEAEDKKEDTTERLDRISVKDGTRIHLIPLDEAWYLQAGGDYVTIATPSGQYVKEQTLTYFETHLPHASFVRIHRSCIVNVHQILRVELFGKENYQVKLKCGVSLRASVTGYKLLKKRLSL